MNSYKILVCEDSPADRRNIQLYLSTIKKALPDVDIVPKIVGFDETYDELGNAYDLLILDLGDAASNSNAGENILLHNKGNPKPIPTLVYTGTADSFGWDYINKKNEYRFLVEKLTKIHNSGDNLIEYVKGLIIVSSGLKKYNLYSPFDMTLQLSIRLIGEDNFNYILHNIFEKYKKEITVYPMTPGLSGAVLFKLEIDNTPYILKLSKEILKLREEHENGKNLYNEFPSHLTNHIVPDEYESFDRSVLGFLIKNVGNAQTLFDFISTCATNCREKIHKFFETLYLDSNSLADFIRIKKGSAVNWSSIFEKIDDYKISLARKSFKELTPIFAKYYHNFDFEDFRRLAIAHDYRHLQVNQTLGDRFSTTMTLSHGDFHSKNILIQGGNRPVIIDTGSIQFQHWCLDYCRLIVHIFINGIDYGRVDFFDLSSLPHNISMIEKIIAFQEIDSDGLNDNFIIALNWLLVNCEKIYGNVNRFEFHLGLMKEFLQVSYRFDTIPPNKRAIALIGAHKCMLTADGIIEGA